MKALILITAFLMPCIALAGATCHKKVFNVLCLGGDAKTALKKVKVITSKESAGGITHAFVHKGKTTFAVEVNNKIASVARMIDRPTYLKLSKLLSSLDHKYGEHKKLDYFPAYVTSPEQMATTARIGKGEFRRHWQQDAWSITVTWHGDRILLTYTDDALMKIYGAKQLQSNDL